MIVVAQAHLCMKKEGAGRSVGENFSASPMSCRLA